MLPSLPERGRKALRGTGLAGKGYSSSAGQETGSLTTGERRMTRAAACFFSFGKGAAGGRVK
jgi:hypothetical protein